MPTIAEILAKKSAARVERVAEDAGLVDLLGEPSTDRIIKMENGPHYAKLVDSTGRFLKWLPKPESIAERMDLKEAIDRIDPKGKRKGALILNDTPPPKPPEPPKEPEQRALRATAGEEIDVTPTTATAEQAAWHRAAVCLESDLCLVMDPDRELNPETVWLAVRHADDRSLPPILIHRLPWPFTYPEPQPTESQPF